MEIKLLLHYGELFLKKKNRRDFIRQLEQNVIHTLKAFRLDLNVKHDSMTVTNFSLDEKPLIIEALQNISGLKLISEVVSVAPDLEYLNKVILKIVREMPIKTFKVVTRRKDKSFPLNSDQINRHIATNLLKNTPLKVNIHTPDYFLRVQILHDEMFFITKQHDGLGGYPLGSAGKALLLLSGGIDSPVAGFLTLRRGIKLEAIHFASPPYTSKEVIDKIKSLLRKLNVYQAEIVLHTVPFTELQLEIYKYVPESYAITIIRRMMMRISSEVMKKRRAKALVTGESLGQVASQTLESLAVINSVTNVPIIRPLATLDKVDIVNIAKKIDTYKISILPYEDMCTIFPNTNPVTKPREHLAESYESNFDYASLIKKAIEETLREVIKIEVDPLL
ncbi:MAG TPA: tRNA uracil 4-sulfurtransferase ThiI [Bacilli bacterium]|nr:tRNA uracil 4-sulfurtransferase ThiI [Bacilli bacterium]